MESCLVHCWVKRLPLSSAEEKESTFNISGETPLCPSDEPELLDVVREEREPSEESEWGWSSSSCDCSGEAEEDAARRSRSSRRLLSFLPMSTMSLERRELEGKSGLTVVSLGNAVLNPASLS